MATRMAKGHTAQSTKGARFVAPRAPHASRRMVTSGLGAVLGLSFIAALGAPTRRVLAESTKFLRIGTGRFVFPHHLTFHSRVDMQDPGER